MKHPSSGSNRSRQHFIRLPVGLVGVALLCACATVNTRPLSHGEEGIAYNLPMGLLEVKVFDAGGIITISAGGPVMVGDKDAALIARLPRGAAADDNVTVTVNATTRLLESVDVSSTGKITDIAKGIAGTVSALQSSGATTGDEVYRGLFTLAEVESGQAASALNNVLQAHFETKCLQFRTAAGLPFAGAVADSDRPEKAALKALVSRCHNMLVAGLDGAAARSLVKISLASSSAFATNNVAPIKPGDPKLVDLATLCRPGVCYRPLKAYPVTLSVAGAFTRTDNLLFPDPATVLRIKLTGGAFATQKYTLQFGGGVLNSYKQDSQSELVGLVKLPLDVAKEILSAPLSLVKGKTDALAAESAYLTAAITNAENKAKVEAKCKETPEFCPGGAYKLIQGTINNGAGSADSASGGASPGAAIPGGS